MLEVAHSLIWLLVSAWGHFKTIAQITDVSSLELIFPFRMKDDPEVRTALSTEITEMTSYFGPVGAILSIDS